MKLRKVIFLALCLLAAASCSVTRSLKDGEYLLRKNRVQVDDSSFNASELSSYISQKPNSFMLGINPLLSVYNWGGDGSTRFRRFLQNIGVKPVVYEPGQVDKSIHNIENHLQYIGYYGSQVESQVSVKGRKVYVTYYVALGKRYKISTIDYEIPQYGTFAEDFKDDLPNTGLAAGQYLSESALEKEAERSAQAFRNKGYYGFNKSFYAFEADTLASDDKAKLKVFIRDYALGDSPSTATEHRKYTLGKVTIAHPERLGIRPSVLENLNTLRPGQLYDEREINTAYTRFASLGMLSGVNVNMVPASESEVDCNITLRNSRLQSVKADLEASVNSTGLFGISPQINYYHKNIFHGGERLNIGLKGNFQFKPKDDIRSTDLSLTTSIRFPQMVGFPNRLFKGPHIPTTDVTLAFVYQNRPEFRRTNIATSFTYNGRVGNFLFYQFTPFRANIARLFDVDPDFWFRLLQSNPFLISVYSDHFDMGVSGMLYYTTNSATIPRTPYHYIRLGVDVSGNLLSLFNGALPTNEYGEHTIWNTPYYQYVRAELNLGKVFRFGPSDKHALALHAMAGAGYAYGNSTSIPVEKQFYAGGSMSMRGWQARTLGPGTSEYLDIFAIPSQIGAMKLEANVEYRFPITWKLEGALFVDAGNVWEVKDEYDLEDGSVFRLKDLPKSVGLDWGLGIRVNLDFILVRLDGGIRLHDPNRRNTSRWVPVNEWFKGNYAIHFGVGYPF